MTVVNRTSYFSSRARGAVLIELALVLPILVILVGGVLAYEILLREFTVTLSAARYGGRRAAAMSFPRSSAPKCAIGEIDRLAGPASFPYQAIEAAEKFLSEASLRPSFWRARAEIVKGAVRGGYSPTLIRVSVEPVQGQNVCIACWFSSLLMPNPRPSFVFSLAGAC